jgi:DNA-binding transcriptional LysR family regulator
MTLEQLKVLVKIAETGSLLAAAAALHRSQPTVTVAVRKLEEELRVPLLDREQYRATLTAEGRLLCQQAQLILKHAADFSTLAGHLATGHEPELHVAIEASCPLPLLLQILRDSERNYPQTAFNLQMENIRGALDKLLNAEVNLAISPWFEDHQQLESLPLCETRLLTVAAPGYCPSPALNLETMRQLVQVVVRDSSQRSYPQQSFGILDGGRHWKVNDHPTKKLLILAGLGWGRLHQHLIVDELADGRLLSLAIDNYPCVLDIEIRAVRRLGEPVGPVAAALWQDFKNFART